MNPDTYCHPFRIDAGHPCLPGHFPGRPLIPAVVLMEAVAEALRHWRGTRLAGIADAKFLAPLAPGQDAEVLLEVQAAGTIRFTLRAGTQVFARGRVEDAR